MNCNNNKHSLPQGKMMTMVVVAVTLSTLLVTMTATQAFGAINLNSSKSNIYRSTQNVQANEGGSVEYQSTINCDCPSDDDNTYQLESSDSGDQVISGDDTIILSNTVTTEITQSADTDCSADGEGAEVNCNVSQESNGAGSPVTYGPINTSRSNIKSQ